MVLAEVLAEVFCHVPVAADGVGLVGAKPSSKAGPLVAVVETLREDIALAVNETVSQVRVELTAAASASFGADELLVELRRHRADADRAAARSASASAQLADELWRLRADFRAERASREARETREAREVCGRAPEAFVAAEGASLLPATRSSTRVVADISEIWKMLEASRAQMLAEVRKVSEENEHSLETALSPVVNGIREVKHMLSGAWGADRSLHIGEDLTLIIDGHAKLDTVHAQVLDELRNLRSDVHREAAGHQASFHAQFLEELHNLRSDVHHKAPDNQASFSELPTTVRAVRELSETVRGIVSLDAETMREVKVAEPATRIGIGSTSNPEVDDVQAQLLSDLLNLKAGVIREPDPQGSELLRAVCTAARQNQVDLSELLTAVQAALLEMSDAVQGIVSLGAKVVYAKQSIAPDAHLLAEGREVLEVPRHMLRRGSCMCCADGCARRLQLPFDMEPFFAEARRLKAETEAVLHGAILETRASHVDLAKAVREGFAQCSEALRNSLPAARAAPTALVLPADDASLPETVPEQATHTAGDSKRGGELNDADNALLRVVLAGGPDAERAKQLLQYKAAARFAGRGPEGAQSLEDLDEAGLLRIVLAGGIEAQKASVLLERRAAARRAGEKSGHCHAKQFLRQKSAPPCGLRDVKEGGPLIEAHAAQCARGATASGDGAERLRDEAVRRSAEAANQPAGLLPLRRDAIAGLHLSAARRLEVQCTDGRRFSLPGQAERGRSSTVSASFPSSASLPRPRASSVPPDEVVNPAAAAVADGGAAGKGVPSSVRRTEAHLGAVT